MTTVISSHVKDKNLSSLNTKFSSLEKSWYFIGVYIIKIHNCVLIAEKTIHQTTKQWTLALKTIELRDTKVQ